MTLAFLAVVNTSFGSNPLPDKVSELIEPSPTALRFEQLQIASSTDKVNSTASSDFLQAQVKEMEITDTEKTLLDMKAHLASSWDFQIGRSTYRVELFPSDPEDTRILEFMTSEQKMIFLERRFLVIQNVLRSLHSYSLGKTLLGAGVVTKNNFTQKVFYQFYPGAYFKLSSEEKAVVDQLQTDWMKSGSVGQAIITKIIKYVNNMLWRSGLILATSSETGLYLSMSVTGVANQLHKIAGKQAELGFTYGRNYETGKWVFRVAYGYERALQPLITVPFVSMGVNLKFGRYYLRADSNGKFPTMHGRSYYPPGAPGYFSISGKMAQFGYSSTWGLPGSDFAGYMMETNYKFVDGKSLGLVLRGIPSFAYNASLKTWELLRVSVNEFSKSIKELRLTSGLCENAFLK